MKNYLFAWLLFGLPRCLPLRNPAFLANEKQSMMKPENLSLL